MTTATMATTAKKWCHTLAERKPPNPWANHCPHFWSLYFSARPGGRQSDERHGQRGVRGPVDRFESGQGILVGHQRGVPSMLEPVDQRSHKPQKGVNRNKINTTLTQN